MTGAQALGGGQQGAGFALKPSLPGALCVLAAYVHGGRCFEVDWGWRLRVGIHAVQALSMVVAAPFSLSCLAQCLSPPWPEVWQWLGLEDKPRKA